MTVLRPGPETELALATWWASLMASGELAAIMPPSLRSLRAFLARFEPPTLVCAAQDAAGLWVVIWAAPWLSGALVNLWVRADCRRQRRALKAVLTGLDLCLRVWPTLLVLADPPRQALYRKGGVVFGGVVPGLWDGQDTAIGWLTRAGFAAVWRPADGATREAVPA